MMSKKYFFEYAVLIILVCFSISSITALAQGESSGSVSTREHHESLDSTSKSNVEHKARVVNHFKNNLDSSLMGIEAPYRKLLPLKDKKAQDVAKAWNKKQRRNDIALFQAHRTFGKIPESRAEHSKKRAQLSVSGTEVTVPKFDSENAKQQLISSSQDALYQTGVDAIHRINHPLFKNMQIGSSYSSLQNGKYSLSTMIPLWMPETNKSAVFMQPGYNHQSERNTLNLGVGYRSISDDNTHMWGGNLFWDNDLSGHNQRMSLGGEYKSDLSDISTNIYGRLTDWHESDYYKDRMERPANGWDLRLKQALPFYPQIQVTSKIEQWYGDQVDPMGTEQFYRNPINWGVGLNYQPMSLVHLSVQHEKIQGGEANDTANLSLSYRFGVPLKKQLEFQFNPVVTHLKDKLFDKVARSYRVVLDTKKIEPRISLPATIKISGGSSEILPLSVQYEDKIKSYEWDELGSKYLDKNNIKRPLFKAPLYIYSKSGERNLGVSSLNSYPLHIQARTSDGSYLNARTVVDITPNPKNGIHIIGLKSSYYHVPNSERIIKFGISALPTEQDNLKCEIQGYGGYAKLNGKCIIGKDKDEIHLFPLSNSLKKTRSSKIDIDRNISISVTDTVTNATAHAQTKINSSTLKIINNGPFHWVRNTSVDESLPLISVSGGKPPYKYEVSGDEFVNNVYGVDFSDEHHTLVKGKVGAESPLNSYDVHYRVVDSKGAELSDVVHVDLNDARPDVTRSSYMITQDNAIADGKSNDVIRISLKSIDSEPSTGYLKNLVAVAIPQKSSSNKITASLVESLQEPGIYYANFSNTQSGAYKLEIEINNSPIMNHSGDVIHFIAGPASAKSSMLSVDVNKVETGEPIVATVQLKDAHGNTLTGIPTKAQVNATQFRFRVPGSASMEDKQGVTGGKVQVTIADAKAESVMLEAAYEGAQVVNSPQPLTFTTGNVDAGSSVLSVDNTHVAAGEPIVATVQLKDTHGNPLTGVPTTAQVDATQFSLRVPGSASMKEKQAITGGKVKVTIADTKAESVMLEAAYEGVQVVNSPQPLTFTTGNVDAGSSVLSVDNRSVAAGDPIVATVQLKDAHGNPLTGVPTTAQVDAAKFNFTVPGSARMGDKQGVTGGKVQVTIDDRKVESVTLAAAYEGAQVVNSPQPLTFTTGNIDAGSSVLSVDNTRVAAGDPIVATVRLKDAHGNPLKGVPTAAQVDATKFNFTVPGSASMKEKQGVMGGKVQVTIDDAKAESVTLEATYEGAQVVNSPQNLIFNTGNVDAGSSVLSVDNRSVAAGDPIVATVQLKDTHGNPLTGVPTIAQVDATKFNFTVPGSASMKEKQGVMGGKVQVTIDDTKAESVTLEATYEGAQVMNSPQKLTYNLGVPNQGVLAVSNNSVLAGELIIATVQLKDTHGNPLTGVPTTAQVDATQFSLRVPGSASMKEKQAITGGKVKVTIADTKAESVMLEAAYEGVQVVNSPQPLTFTTGNVDAGSSVLSVDNRSVTAGDPIVATVQLKDTHGNPLKGVPTIAQVDATKFTFTVPGSASMKEKQGVTGGKVQVTIDDTKAESVTLEATYEGAQVVNSPQNLIFNTGNVDAGSSVLSVDNRSVAAGDPIVATVRLKDAHGNPLKGVPTAAQVDATRFNFTVPGSASMKEKQGVTGGKVQVTIDDAKAESVTLEATYEGAQVVNSPQNLIFNTGNVDAGSSVLSVDNRSVAAGDPIVATVQLKDTHGNPLTGVPTIAQVDATKFTFTVPGSASMKEKQGVTGGKVQVTIDDTKAESATLEATYEGAQVVNSPQPLTFNAGDVDAGSSVLSVDNRSVAAGEPIVATVQLKDAHGNPLIGVPTIAQVNATKFNLTVPGSASMKEKQGVTGGKVQVTIDDTKAESATLVATYNHIRVLGSPKVLTFTAGNVNISSSRYEVSPTELIVNQNAQITFIAKDSYGNPTTRGFSIGDISANFDGYSGEKPSVTFSSKDQPVGHFVARFTDQKAEKVRVKVSLDTHSITANSDDESSVVFESGPAVQSNSDYAIDWAVPSKNIANGVDAAVLRVTLRDMYKNPVTNGIVSQFNQQLGGSAIESGSWINHNDGTYTLYLTDTVAEAVSPSNIKYGSMGLGLNGNGSVTFLPGPVSSKNSSYMVTVNDKLTTTSEGSITDKTGMILLELKDQHNNILSNINSSDIHVLISKNGKSATIGKIIYDSGDEKYHIPVTAYYGYPYKIAISMSSKGSNVSINPSTGGGGVITFHHRSSWFGNTRTSAPVVTLNFTDDNSFTFRSGWIIDYMGDTKHHVGNPSGGGVHRLSGQNMNELTSLEAWKHSGGWPGGYCIAKLSLKGPGVDLNIGGSNNPTENKSWAMDGVVGMDVKGDDTCVHAIRLIYEDS
ncbi:inverse autotransporter beta domain-containing protein [Dongshaea marina]|uniref:inverse autotransporter beta domain-containing protein n=1 Tax=Dongshaea marina TaxID=2047966 RepID=UPI00131F1D21|nr:inverse autotransporter beta domain-containing protein [Dongshaea marina]